MTDKNRFEVPDLIEEKPDRWQGMKDKQAEDDKQIEDDKLPDGWPSRMEMIDALYRALGLPLNATHSPKRLWMRALEEVAALRMNDMLYPEHRQMKNPHYPDSSSHVSIPRQRTKTLFYRADTQGAVHAWEAALFAISEREQDGYAVRQVHTSELGVLVVLELPDRGSNA